MFVVLLKLSATKEQIAEWMPGHKEWLQQGFADGIFIASGNLQEQAGGGILAHGLGIETLRERLNRDPFVAHGIVSVQIIDLAVSQADPRLAFLLENKP